MNKRIYTKPTGELAYCHLEESIASASITPHLQQTGTINEEWEEDELIFPDIQW